MGLARDNQREVPMSMSELEVLAHIDREMLYSFVWGIPSEVLAERMRVSVDSIQRSCANRGIPYPDEGYWMKVAAGMKPKRPPLTKHRPGPRGTTGPAEGAVEDRRTDSEDPLAVIDGVLGEGTVDLIVRTARGITVDHDAKLRPHLRWQRDACRSERTLEGWLSKNELPRSYLWREASPSSVARMCAILEAMGRAAEQLGGTYGEDGFDLFGEKVHVFFSEHLGKYRRGQTPSRTYNGLLSMYVGTDVYKDYRKKTLEQDVPRAFANLCVNAAYQAKARRDAFEALIETKARYATRQASIAAENERRKEFNREVERYEVTLRVAEAHDRAERLRRYADSLERTGALEEADWVRRKADWADPVTHTSDDIFGDEHTPDGSAPERKRQIPFDTRSVEANAFFTQPLGDPSPTLESYKQVLRQSRARPAVQPVQDD